MMILSIIYIVKGLGPENEQVYNQNTNWNNFLKNCIIHKVLKQEAHGPHHSPEKTVQINNTNDYIIMVIKRRKTHYILYENLMVLHLNKFVSP